MLVVLKAGLYTSIQDLGRIGFRNYGVPVSGVMDTYHSKLANHILGNDVYDAVLEITLQGPSLHFHESTQIAITGADLSPKLNNKPVKLNSRITIAKGDVLEFGTRTYGVRTYLAVKNGFQTGKVLKSYSFYEGITEKSRIEKGDLLNYASFHEQAASHVTIAQRKTVFTNKEINVYKGPEFDLLSDKQQKMLLKSTFSIGLNNRMAYQLNELLQNDLPSIITSSVLPGTVQLTPSGKLIVLMKDCQTTGGYPRILQLDEIGMCILAQKYTGETIKFKMISIS